MSKCYYCTKLRKLTTDTPWFGIELAINFEVKSVEVVDHIKDISYASLPIHYCPYCGRKLTEEEQLKIDGV